MQAIGCHVFAGGFTWGVRQVMNVPLQLEVHGLGAKTVRTQGHKFVMGSDWQDWPKEEGDFLFGNPRCTGFSCVTAGYGEDAHGAWSKPTKDIHQFCNYGVTNGFPVICWESVQQAYTVGRPLLDYLRDTLFTPNRYRICHLFINAASFGNAQHRRRYFFLAYKDDKNFNVEPPRIPERHTTVGDVICTPEFEGYESNVQRFAFKKSNPNKFTPDCYAPRSRTEEDFRPYLPRGYCLNGFAHKHEDLLERFSPELAEYWHCRTSDMPFSMHCLARADDRTFMPVIAGTCSRFAHPFKDRQLTVRELSRLMGWPPDVLPQGPDPFAELGKGVVPAVGEWLARQVELYLNNAWGKADWESSYDPRKGRWEGRRFDDDPIPPPEKVIDVTRYCPPKPPRPEWLTSEQILQGVR